MLPREITQLRFFDESSLLAWEFSTLSCRIMYNQKPIPDLDAKSSVVAYSIRIFGYKTGNKVDANILAAFDEARRLTIRCFEEKWINNEYKITNNERVLNLFNSTFTKTGLSVFSIIKNINTRSISCNGRLSAIKMLKSIKKIQNVYNLL